MNEAKTRARLKSMIKDKLKFYLSKLKTYLVHYNNKFIELSKIKKIITVLSVVCFFLAIILFITRDKPENIKEFADSMTSFNSSNGLKTYNSFFPTIGEDLLLEKMIVNLKQTEDHPLAIGMFEVFLNISNVEFVQQVQEKEYLLQDVLQRELEGYTYEKLSTPQGKKVAKVLLRNRANKALGKKLIKRLYFKTFVLQP